MNTDLNKRNKKGQMAKKHRSEQSKIDSEFGERATMVEEEEDREKGKLDKVGLSDLIIKKHLAHTLQIYREDLAQL
jgi:hypothetical protein